jgi:hypothetical protein
MQAWCTHSRKWIPLPSTCPTVESLVS